MYMFDKTAMLKRMCFDILPRIKRKRRLVLTSNLQSKQLQNSTENVTCKNLYYFLIFILDWNRFSNASSSVLMLSYCKVKSDIFVSFFFTIYSQFKTKKLLLRMSKHSSPNNRLVFSKLICGFGKF